MCKIGVRTVWCKQFSTGREVLQTISNPDDVLMQRQMKSKPKSMHSYGGFRIMCYTLIFLEDFCIKLFDNYIFVRFKKIVRSIGTETTQPEKSKVNE